MAHLYYKILALLLILPTPSACLTLDNFTSSLDTLTVLKSESRPSTPLLRAAQDKFFWHYSFPTVGLYKDPQFFPPAYPFMPHCFTLWQLAPRKGAGIKIALIDTGVDTHVYQHRNLLLADFSPASNHTDTYSLTYCSAHGNHSAGLIAGQSLTGVHGIAPEATLLNINAFSDQGISTLPLLNKALAYACTWNADIANFGFKIADHVESDSDKYKIFDYFVHRIPYTVAAAGNDGDSTAPRYAGATLAYPARCSTMDFTVGAFDFTHNSCVIPAFSQYELGKGPRFLAPGVDIISYGHNPNTYLVMKGTSCATALISGFLALVLAEFKEYFTHDQIMRVCYKASLKMHKHHDWDTRVVMGVPDMRTVLFILHVLRYLNEQISHSSHHKKFHQKPHFDYLLEAVVYILFVMPELYGSYASITHNFRSSFIDYWQAALKKRQHLDRFSLAIPPALSLQDAIKHIAHPLLKALKIPHDLPSPAFTLPDHATSPSLSSLIRSHPSRNPSIRAFQ